MKTNQLLIMSLIGLTLAGLSSSPVQSASQRQFSDDHEDGRLTNWRIYGKRKWLEHRGAATPAPESTDPGFLIHQSSVSKDGVLKIRMSADHWSGNEGGVVFRWQNTRQYYFVSVLPGNRWTGALVFCKNNMDVANGVIIASPIRIDTTFDLKIAMKGSQFTFFLDDVLQGSITDNSHKKGRIGYAYGAAWSDYLDFHQVSWQSGLQVAQKNDFDADKIEDRLDNCPKVANHDQHDQDGNGIGDACEGNRPKKIVAQKTAAAVAQPLAISSTITPPAVAAHEEEVSLLQSMKRWSKKNVSEILHRDEEKSVEQVAIDQLQLRPRATPPASPVQGLTYLNASEALCIYLGKGWVKVVGQGHCQANEALGESDFTTDLW